MRRILTTVLTATALLGTAATAQQAAQQAAQEPAFPTSQELSDKANGVVARFAGWEVRCADTGANCRIFQVAQDDKGNNVVSVTMQALPEGASAKLGVVMVSPLLTLLPRGLSVSVDDGVPAAYPFSWCDPQGCYSRFGLTPAQVEAFEAGTAANIDIFAVTSPDAAVRAVLPLDGFTEAVADLLARQAG